MDPNNRCITSKYESYKLKKLEQSVSQSLDTSQLRFYSEPTSIDSSSGNSSKKKVHKSKPCDCCAIRKKKCEASRPCSHCKAKKLKCTNLRIQKKRGPKKTLDTSHDSKSSPIMSNNSYSSTIYLLERDNEDNVKRLTPQLLIDILLLGSEDSTIFELLKPLTVQSIINNTSLIKFLSTKYHNELEHNLRIDQSDSHVISILAVILSLNLLILENLTKLSFINSKDCILSKTVRHFLEKGLLANYKSQLKFVITEILSTLDVVSLFPDFVLSIGQNEINYNLSLTCLHLSNYNMILNLRNQKTLQNDQQKLILLRKSISYYQLIYHYNQNDLSVIQIYELSEYLYTAERFYLLNTNLFINSNYLLLNNWQSTTFNISKKVNKNILFEVFKILEKEDVLNLQNLQKILNFNDFNNFQLEPFVIMGTTIIEAKFIGIKNLILNISNNESYLEILKLVILFRILLLTQGKVTALFFENEINYTINELIKLLTDDDLLKVQISNHQLFTHLLLILKTAILLKARNETNLLTYSNQLTLILPIFNNKKISSDDILNDWFNHLKDINKSPIPVLDLKLKVMTICNKENEEISNELMYGFGNEIPSNHFSIPITPEGMNITPELSLLDYIISKPDTIDTLISDIFTDNYLSKDPDPSTYLVTSATHQIEEENDDNNISLSESTKSLFNIFHQIYDNLSPSTSFSNLLQLYGMNLNQDNITTNANTF